MNSFSSNNSYNRVQNKKNKNENMKIQKEDYYKNEENTLNNLIDKINISQTLLSSEENDNNKNNENNDRINNNNKPNDVSYKNKTNNFINKSKDNSEIEFEKVLKSEFSCIYSNPKSVESNI